MISICSIVVLFIGTVQTFFNLLVWSVFFGFFVLVFNANYLLKSKIYAVNMKEELCSIIDWVSICNKQKIFWNVLVFRKTVINGLACILCVTVGIDSIGRNDLGMRIRSEEHILILASDFDIGFVTR